MMQLNDVDAERLITALERVERILKRIENQKAEKPVWVKVGELKNQTIWQNAADTERAREMSWVKYRINNGGIEYDLTSINEKFLKQNALQTS